MKRKDSATQAGQSLMELSEERARYGIFVLAGHFGFILIIHMLNHTINSIIRAQEERICKLNAEIRKLDAEKLPAQSRQ